MKRKEALGLSEPDLASTKATSIIVALAVLAACSTRANTIVDTYPAWDGNVTFGWPMMAQTFTVPIDNVLLSFQFETAPRNSSGALNFSIYSWAAISPSGPALYSVDLPWTTAGGRELASDINLPLVAGQLYGAVINLRGYTDASVHFESMNPYSGGDGYWSADGVRWGDAGLGYDLQFRAEFGNVVPEPSASLLLGAGLASVCLRVHPRRR